MTLFYRLSVLLVALSTFSVSPALAQNATPSPALLDALNAVRTSPLAQVTARVAQLSPPERDAMMYWLESHGRGALHALGVTDAQIGVPYYAIDYNLLRGPWPATVQALAEPAAAPAPTNPPTPAPRRHSFNVLGAVLPELQIPIASSSSSSSQTTTTNTANGTETDTTTQSSGSSVSIGVNPWAVVGALIDASTAHTTQPAPSEPWRGLTFAASTLGSGGSAVRVTRGFAAVRNDGSEGLACISFANNGQKVANEVDVDIEILDTLGFIRRVAPLRLRGSFAPGVEVGGPANVHDVDSARDNCVIDGENALADTSDPFNGAGAVVYSVRRVLFADGSQWLQPGANAWPPVSP